MNSNLKYKCLILDHDDTVMDSTAHVHHPAFLVSLAELRPGRTISLEDYFRVNFHPGFVEYCRRELGFTEPEFAREVEMWKDYVKDHIPSAYPAMARIIRRQKEAGGLVCVISHSFDYNIRRDYAANGLPEPDAVYGWECPPHLRKPSPWAVEQIMARHRLSPDQVLVLDDLKPGHDMARAAGVDFAAAGWANDIGEIERFMRENCRYYFKTVEAFGSWLFE